MAKAENSYSGKIGLLEKLRPVQRSVISIVAAFLIFLFLPKNLTLLVRLLISWSAFSICYIIFCWNIICKMPVHEIKKVADREDGSTAYVFTVIILACIASFCAVLFIIISDKEQHLPKLASLAITVLSMLFSWSLVHTVFTFHYAHLYYKGDKAKKPLDFPGDEPPDYMDFAYFSFVMGCTFQVSDVEITSKQLRKTALFHGLLSFALNTFVIALSINIISGLVH